MKKIFGFRLQDRQFDVLLAESGSFIGCMDGEFMIEATEDAVVVRELIEVAKSLTDSRNACGAHARKTSLVPSTDH